MRFKNLTHIVVWRVNDLASMRDLPPGLISQRCVVSGSDVKLNFEHDGQIWEGQFKPDIIKQFFEEVGGGR
jgi:hypothetical protein